MTSPTIPSPPPPARTGPPTPPRPRASVTWEGSSLAPLLNRMRSSYPGTGTLTPDMSRVNRALALSLVVAVAAAALSIAWTADAPGAPAATAAAAPTTAELVGQRLMVAMRGTRPSPALRGRIRRGQIGGVIL